MPRFPEVARHRGLLDRRRMVRFHALPLFRDGAVAGVLRRRRGRAGHDAGRLRGRLSDAAGRRRLLRPYRRPARAAADAAAVDGGDDRGDAGDRPAADPRRRSGRRRRWLLILLRCVMGFSVGGEYTGVVAYLLEGSRPERRGLIASLGGGGERGRRAARGRRFGADGQPDERSRSRAVGLAHPLPGRRGARRDGVDRALGDGGIARLRAAGRASRTVPTNPLRHALAISAARSAAPSPSRRWARSLIMSGSPTCRPSSPRRIDGRGGVAVAVDRSRRSS